MRQTYTIQGMTCNGCVRRVTAALETLPAVTKAEVQLEAPQATLQLSESVPTADLQATIGHYTIEPIATPQPTTAADLPEKNLSTYFPLALIIAFLTGVTLLAQWPLKNFDFSIWMRHFMAGFFLVFSFFKLLNLRGFADSYAMYDLVAARWRGWGFVYPFVELGLGVLYLTNSFPFFTNLLTVVVLGISSIGVIQSVLDQRKIKCACLGDVFNLPMSTVTIVEDVAMVAMAAAMLWMM
ncbi:MAG: MauE/DoxX family redox-associated membrane protein [Bacteroidota bacterium]